MGEIIVVVLVLYVFANREGHIRRIQQKQLPS